MLVSGLGFWVTLCVYCIKCYKGKGTEVAPRFPERVTFVHSPEQETLAHDCKSHRAFHIQWRKDSVMAMTYSHAAANLDSGFLTAQVVPNQEE